MARPPRDPSRGFAGRIGVVLALAGLLAPVIGTTGCSAILRNAWTRSGYAKTDRLTTLRVAVVTAPLPAGRADLGKMWSVMARRWMNHHRDFIAKRALAAAKEPADECDGVDAVLHLVPHLARRGDAVEAEVHATLLRCKGRVPIWSADAGGTFPVAAGEVKELTNVYAKEMGEPARPYVAASYLLLRAALDALPHPKLVKDADVMEKIEIGD